MKTIFKTILLATATSIGAYSINVLVHKNDDTVAQAVARAVKAKDSTTVEFTDLYRPVKEIPYGGEDTIHAGHLLSKMGFKQTDYGWGNGMLPVLSMRSAHYHKKGCDCDVYKQYYETETEGIYAIKEGITCYP